MKNNSVLSYFLLFITTFLWGGSFVLSKIVFKTLDPFTTIWTRLLISCLILFIILIIFYRKEYSLTKSDWKNIALIAFFLPFLYFIGEHTGLIYVDAVTSSLVIGLIPAFTALSVFLFFGTRLSIVNIIGICLSFAGVILVVITGSNIGSVNIYGLLFLILAVFSGVAYGLCLKNVAEKIHPVWLVFVQNLYGVIYFLPIVLIYGKPMILPENSQISFLTPMAEFLLALLILGVFCSSVTYIFYSMAVKRIGLTRTAIFNNCMPIFTAVISYMIFEQSLSYKQIVGMCLIIAGVFLTQKKYRLNSNRLKN